MSWLVSCLDASVLANVLEKNVSTPSLVELPSLSFMSHRVVSAILWMFVALMLLYNADLVLG